MKTEQQNKRVNYLPTRKRGVVVLREIYKLCVLADEILECWRVSKMAKHITKPTTQHQSLQTDTRQ